MLEAFGHRPDRSTKEKEETSDEIAEE